MGSLNSELASVLCRIAKADAAGGGDVRFTPFFIEEAAGPVGVDPSIDDCETLQAGSIFALRNLGYLEVAPPTAVGNGYGPFQLTHAGRDAIARFREPAARSDGPIAPADTSFERLRPILVAVVQEWELRRARGSVPTDAMVSALGEEVQASDARLALELLEKGDWLAGDWEMGTDWPIEVTPTPRGLAEVRGWPTQTSDTAVVTGLIRALDEAIEQTQDPAERSRLQALRSAAGDVGKSVLAGALLAAGKWAAGS